MKEGHAGSSRLALQMQRRELRLRHTEQRMKRQELQLRQHEKRVMSQLRRAKRSEHEFGDLESSSEPVSASAAELETSSDLGKRLISKGKGYEEEVKLLIQQGVDVNFVKRVGKTRYYTALHCAASRGFCGIISILAGAGANLEEKDELGTTALLDAAGNGHLEAIHLLIQLGASPTWQDINGFGLLHLAAYHGHPEVALLLCSRDDIDIDINGVNKYRQTPAYISCMRGNLDVLKALVSYHADIAARDSSNRTPLHGAACNGQVEIMEYLLQQGADPMAVDLEGVTPLHEAVRAGKEASVQILLRYNVDVNMKTARFERHSPLMEAAMNGRTEVMRLLIENGADRRAVNSFGNNLIHLATLNNHSETIRFFMENEAEIESINNNQQTPLIVATRGGWMDAVHLLVGYKASLHAQDIDGATSLHWAVRTQDKLLVRYLVKQGADIEVEDSDGMTALSKATCQGNKDIVSFLLDRGANIAAKDRHGRTALHLAAQEGLDALVEILLDKGADSTDETATGKRADQLALNNGHDSLATMLANRISVSKKGLEQSKALVVANLVATAANGTNAQLERILDEDPALIDSLDLNGRSAISTAAENGHCATVELLHKRGSLIDVTDGNGETALWWAARNGHIHVVERLLELNASTDIGDADKLTPLCAAAQKGHGMVVSVLLRSGGNVNAATTYGKTPLMLATIAGNLQMVQLLIDNGAEVRYSHRRTTALSLAERAEHQEIIELLRLHHAMEEEADAQSKNAETKLSAALAEAAEQGQMAEIVRLVKAGADPNGTSCEARPLILASKEGHTKAVEVLIDCNAKVDLVGERDETAVTCSASSGYVDIVKILHKHGANIDHLDEENRPAIWHAAWEGQEKAVRLLIDLGAKKDIPDVVSRTPLWVASERGHMGVVEALLEHGSNIECADRSGRTPLLLAVQADNRSLCDLFLEKGACMSIDLRTGGSPLSWAALRGHESIAELLIEHEADLNHVDINRTTPLMLAAMECHAMVVKILIEMGADVDFKDVYERTAMSYAKELRHEPVVKLLSQAGKLRAKNERALRKIGHDNASKRMQYEYAPLPEGFIRVLELRPGKIGDVISIELHHVDILNGLGLSFDALSYEWKGKVGTSEKSESHLKKKLILQAANAIQSKELVVEGWAELSRRSYFQRVWIFQEIILAGSRGLVMCGSLSSPWNVFNAALQGYIAWNGDFIDFIHTLQLNTKSFNDKGHLLVYDAIFAMSTLDCSDARDKVFATLGIVEPGTALEADYTKSVREVFLEANRHVLSLNSLDLWINSQERTSDRQLYDQEAIEGLPSWAYDFTRPIKGFAVPWKDTKDFTDLMVGSPSIIETILHVNGCVLDKIVLTVAITQDQETFENLKHVVQAMAKLHRGIYDLYPSVGRPDLNVANAEGENQSPKETNGDALLAAIFEGGISPKDKLYFGSYLAWKILKDGDIPGDGISKSPPPYLKTRVASWNAKSQESIAFNLDVCRSMERKHRYDWNLSYTGKGYIGLSEGPAPCENTVVALIGDSRHLIMLKKHKQGPDEWYEKAGAIFLYGWNEQTIKTNELKDIDENAEVVRLEIR
ncbi:heterokaryon incompatibility protein-domain-containing protein [Apiospora arundinis]